MSTEIWYAMSDGIRPTFTFRLRQLRQEYWVRGFVDDERPEEGTTPLVLILCGSIRGTSDLSGTTQIRKRSRMAHHLSLSR